ncbi:histidine kinase-like ATPase [Ochromonadaceae sp. CCMP2298]|nr:histidine kinase-like ATPase [Ochromonadaceae sp. CCMP2298]
MNGVRALSLLLLGLCAEAFVPRLFSQVHLTNVAKMPLPISRGNTLLAATVAEPEQFQFESNVARVMDIIINSLYSNKDVFIRELVSNAADACDKKRFNAITSGAPVQTMRIRVYPNRKENTLTIEDSGVGMNRAEIMQNLGRIAESGTRKFKEGMEGQDRGEGEEASNLIGQFGVGFYSGFLVARRMEVITRGSEGQQNRWEASADSLDRYTIAEDDSEPITGTGTRIVLHLKDEADQYLDDVALKALLVGLFICAFYHQSVLFITNLCIIITNLCFLSVFLCLFYHNCPTQIWSF